jgi:hypothetical protein
MPSHTITTSSQTITPVANTTPQQNQTLTTPNVAATGSSVNVTSKNNAPLEQIGLGPNYNLVSLATSPPPPIPVSIGPEDGLPTTGTKNGSIFNLTYDIDAGINLAKDLVSAILPDADAASPQLKLPASVKIGNATSSTTATPKLNSSMATAAASPVQTLAKNPTAANPNNAQVVGGAQSATANSSPAQAVSTTSGSGKSTSATATPPGAPAVTSRLASQASSATTASASQNYYRRSLPSQQQKTTLTVANNTGGSAYSQSARTVTAQIGSSAQSSSALMNYRSAVAPNYFPYAPRPNAIAPAGRPNYQHFVNRPNVNLQYAGQQFYRPNVAPAATGTPNYNSYAMRLNTVAPANRPNYQQFASRANVNAGQQFSRPNFAPAVRVAGNCPSSAPRPNMNAPMRRSR